MKSCALVGAGPFAAERFLEMDASMGFDLVIAVDGGLAHLEAIGKKPALALGDFDSYKGTPSRIRTVRFPSDKDASDMELALRRAQREKCDEVWMFGSLGGRLDHTLANLQVMAAVSEQGMKVTAIGVDEDVLVVSGPDMREFDARESDTISVFSLSDEARGVFERGLRWELDDVALTDRTSLGLSNEFHGEAALVGVETGTIAIIIPRCVI